MSWPDRDGLTGVPSTPGTTADVFSRVHTAAKLQDDTPSEYRRSTRARQLVSGALFFSAYAPRLSEISPDVEVLGGFFLIFFRILMCTNVYNVA